ncbi:MAG: POTRA domain-containing protein [Acidaminococcaceae bacterium]|nr:POTRA domain-containing protein [Acidaminococcaceae bacterium]
MFNKSAVVALGIFMTCVSAQAAEVNRQEQLDEARRADALRQERLQRMQIRNGGNYIDAAEEDRSEYSQGAPVFFIEAVEIEKLPADFKWLNKIARPFVNKEIGLKEINTMVHAMNQELLRRGYVTGRVTIPEQNLSSRKLLLVFEPGYFHAVVPADGAKHVDNGRLQHTCRQCSKKS